MDMGIEPLLLSSSLRLVLAQRLVRRLCPDCKVPDENDDIASHKPVGCPSCQNIGYRGRIGIFELLSVDDTVRQMTPMARPSSKSKLMLLPMADYW